MVYKTESLDLHPLHNKFIIKHIDYVSRCHGVVVLNNVPKNSGQKIGHRMGDIGSQNHL